MAGIQLASGFDLNSPTPLDSRVQFDTIALRNALPAGNRYEGLQVYVKEVQKYFSLTGGIANTNWKELPSAEALAALTARVDSIGDGEGGTAPSIKSSGFPFPNDLVAFWDFSETEAPYYAKAGVDKFPLEVGGTAAPVQVDSLPFGKGLKFSGNTTYLKIDAADVGALNAAKSGDEVTVVAWIKRPLGIPDGNSFIAGMWQEDDNNPKRQYGLFNSLPMYGGAERVCGHISKTGEPSPGLPYSRDYSTSGAGMGKSDTLVRCIALTYDGEFIRSYLDGVSDELKSYTEPGAPGGQGLTYAKNPYKFDLGLNRTSVSDFTVGAVRLTTGMGNGFQGVISGLAVFRRCLTKKEMMRLHLDAKGEGQPSLYFDFEGDTWTGDKTPGASGWNAAKGETGTDLSQTRLNSWTISRLGANTNPAFAYLSSESSPEHAENKTKLNLLEKTGIEGINMSQFTKCKFVTNNKGADNSFKFCIKVDGQWYASKTDITHPGTGASGSDWSTSTITELNISRDIGEWLLLDYELGTKLVLGTNPTTPVPNKQVTNIGLLSNPLKDASIMRVRSIELYS